MLRDFGCASPAFTLEYRPSSPERTFRLVKSKLLDLQGYPAAQVAWLNPQALVSRPSTPAAEPAEQHAGLRVISYGVPTPSSGSTESSNAAPTSSASPAPPPCCACRPACSSKPTTDGKTATAATCPNSPWPCSPHRSRPRYLPWPSPRTPTPNERNSLRHSQQQRRATRTTYTTPWDSAATTLQQLASDIAAGAVELT